MPITSSLLKRAPPASRYRSAVQIKKQNLKHHERVGALGAKSAPTQTVQLRARRLLSARQKYFAQLREIPFVRELLKSQHRFAVEVGGKKVNFTMLKTGIKMEGLNRPIVIVLDNMGRKVLFYKSTGANSKKPGTWLPFRGLEFATFKSGKRDWWYQKYAGHPNFPEHFRLISDEIRKRESEIDFKRKWDSDQVAAINEYF